MRTVFNLLGPLTNPARATSQLIGAPSADAAELMAQALAGFEPECAFVVHGFDGLDEITTTGPTLVYEIRRNQVRTLTWTPADFGVKTANPESLRGDDRSAIAALPRPFSPASPAHPAILSSSTLPPRCWLWASRVASPRVWRWLPTPSIRALRSLK